MAQPEQVERLGQEAEALWRRTQVLDDTGLEVGGLRASFHYGVASFERTLPAYARDKDEGVVRDTLHIGPQGEEVIYERIRPGGPQLPLDTYVSAVDEYPLAGGRDAQHRVDVGRLNKDGNFEVIPDADEAYPAAKDLVHRLSYPMTARQAQGIGQVLRLVSDKLNGAAETQHPRSKRTPAFVSWLSRVTLGH